MSEPQSFTDRMEHKQAEMRERQALRASGALPPSSLGQKARGLGALMIAVLVVLAIVALVGVLLWAFVDSDAWKPVVGFLIAAVVIGGISIGIRKETT